MIWSNLSKTFKYINEVGDSLTLDPEHGFLINRPSGIDTVSVSMSQAQGINQVGVSVQSLNIQPRPVTVSGKLIGDFQLENKDKLLSVVRPDLKGRFYADGYYLSVRPVNTPAVSADREFARFSFTILAPYPYWQFDESATVVLSGVEPSFRLPCNFSRPFRFGRVVENKFLNVQNRGQLPVPFKVTFTARNNCTNPRLTNAATGEFLLVKKSMKTGEKIVVDITHDRTNVTSSVDGDIRGALSLKSKLYRLGVGDNVLKPETDSGSSELEVSIDYATEIVGVTL